MRVLLTFFFKIFTEVDLEKVSPRVRWNHRCECWHIDCRWQVLCSRLSESITPNLNATIWKIKKYFFNSVFHFWNINRVLNILKEKICVRVNVFSKLQTVKKLARTLSKKRRFRTRFDSKHLRASQILAISPWRRI